MEDFTLGLTAEEINRRLSLMDVDKTPITKTLVWENSSPTSAFPRQSMNLDFSEADEVEIEYSSWSGAARVIGKVRMYNDSDSEGYHMTRALNYAYATFVGRRINISRNRITFDDSYDNTGTIRNDNMVPQSIHIIKGVC